MNVAAELNDAQSKTLPLYTDDDVVRLRTQVRQYAVDIGLSLIEQTKLVTAASELARNTLRYGNGGEVHAQLVQADHRRGLRLTFTDHGPGIADLALAMTDGYTSGGGLGLGLGGAKRLVDEFALESVVGSGTTVVITKWKHF